MKAFRITALILLIAWCVMIFSLSNETADESSKTSGGIVETIISILYPDYGNMAEAEQLQLREAFQFIIRKAAHFTIFAVLGALSLLNIITYNCIKPFIQILTAAVFCLLYAISDEIHQLYIPGRSGEVRDVCIDLCGALLGILITYLVIHLFKRRGSNAKKRAIKA